MERNALTRRRLLGALGASLIGGAAGLSGCLGDASTDDEPNGGRAGDGSPTETPTPAQSPSGTVGSDRPTGTTDGPTPTEASSGADLVREVAVAPGLVAPDSPDSYGVYGDRGEQYVIAVLDGRGTAEPPAVDEFALVADGESRAFTNEIGHGNWALFDYGEAYSPGDNKSGWLIANVPKPLDAESVSLTWPGGSHPLGDDALTELRRSPAAFAVRSFETPERADPGDDVTVTVSVENISGVDGTFVAALNRSGPLVASLPEAGIRLPVAAGETETWTFEHTVRDESFTEDRPMKFSLYWREDSRHRTVTVRANATPTATTTDALDTPAETDPRDTPTATESQPISPTPREE
ncbi:MAG: hypothetical protein ABEJ26_08555 [Halosimplex sp.]